MYAAEFTRHIASTIATTIDQCLHQIKKYAFDSDGTIADADKDISRC